MSNGQVVPARLTQARELAGQSKTEVAAALQVSGAAVTQWENGVKRPTHENLAALSRHLGVPLTLFFRDLPLALDPRGPLSFRAWQSAGTRQANRKATRLAELTAEIFLWLDERVTLPAPVLPLPLGRRGRGVDANVDVEAAADATRQTWGLGERPLLKLGELLESRGVFLNPATFGDDRFDAFSCVLGGRPFLFLGTEKQDRACSRFDTAHELGHLVLHRHLDTGELREPNAHALAEAQANRFASAFLLPATTFAADLRETSLHGFLNLKPPVGRVRAEHGGAGARARVDQPGALRRTLQADGLAALAAGAGRAARRPATHHCGLLRLQEPAPARAGRAGASLGGAGAARIAAPGSQGGARTQ